METNIYVEIISLENGFRVSITDSEHGVVHQLRPLFTTYNSAFIYADEINNLLFRYSNNVLEQHLRTNTN